MADPFAATAEAVALLRLRARQLRAAGPVRRSRAAALAARRARAVAALAARARASQAGRA